MNVTHILQSYMCVNADACMHIHTFELPHLKCLISIECLLGPQGSDFSFNTCYIKLDSITPSRQRLTIPLGPSARTDSFFPMRTLSVGPWLLETLHTVIYLESLRLRDVSNIARIGIMLSSTADQIMFQFPKTNGKLELIIDTDINTKSGYVPRVVEIFNSWGFAWGGTWTSPDEMHFELRDLSASISKSSG